MTAVDDSPLLDLGRLRDLDRINQKAKGEVQVFYKNYQELSKKKMSLEAELQGALKVVDHHFGYSLVTQGHSPARSTQQSKQAFMERAEELRVRISEIGAEIAECLANLESAQEKYNAADQLYTACKEYAGARYEQ